MTMIQITSNEEYESIIQSDLSVIYFYAPWADQCKQMNDVLEDISNLHDFKVVKFANIEAEKFPELSLMCKITAVPTTLIFKNGNIVARINGANPLEVKEQIKKHLSDKNESIPKLLEDKIKKLINQAPCMLFMKGNRFMPQCGFSKSIIAILDKHNVEYETFNILEDNEIREGLKKFSNWPTYPQLYYNSKLIGGLDIVKEMSKSGDIDIMLPKKSVNLEDKLQKLINQAPCMLFMKGNRNTPRCGFSKTIVALLNQHNVEYDTFDILEDNEVREGLKKFSDWPTYPQFYVNGKLIGGLDIVKEMSDSGDLDTILPKEGHN